MATLNVGPGQEYATISAAVAASQDGDVIAVQAGTYTNDFSQIWNKVTLEAVGGQVNLVATEPPPNGKAIITTDNDVTIRGFTFSGAAVADANGAGIRYEQGNLILQGCTFEHNQEGLLAASDPAGSITINDCEFGHNGDGSGYTHNLYVNEVGTLTVTNSYFHDAIVGHEIKSRADNTIIENNVIDDGPTSNASYSIDLPDGGNATVKDNTIVKGPDTQNANIIHFGGEGLPYAASSLLVTGNSVTNDRGPEAVLVFNQTLTTAQITGNTLINLSQSQIASGASSQSGNVDGSGRAISSSVQSTLPDVNFDYLNDPAPHTVTGATAFEAIYGGPGHLTISAPAGYQTVLGGAGGVSFTDSGGSGANSIYTEAGSTNTIDLSGGLGEDLVESAGTDSISCGANHTQISVTGAATINAGPAEGNQFAIVGGALINENGGSDQDAIGPQGSVTIRGAEQGMALSDGGGNVYTDAVLNGTHQQFTITGGSVGLNDEAATIAMTTSGGGNGANIALGVGNTLIFSKGADTVRAGAGAATVIVSGAAQVYAGTGTLSVFGRGDAQGATIHGAGGMVTLDGDSGNLTYIGGAQASRVQSNLSRDRFVGGTGHLTVVGPGFSETVMGGSGGVTFASAAGGDVVTTAAGASDSLTLGNNDYLASYGKDSINLAAGDDTVDVRGSANISGGTQWSDVNVYGRAAIITHGGLSVGVAQGGVASVVTNGASLNLWDGGGTAQVAFTGGGENDRASFAGDLTVSGGVGQGLSVTTGGAGARITQASGVMAVHSYGPDTISAAGTMALVARGNAFISELGGKLMVFGDGGDSTVMGGGGAFTYRDDDYGATLHYDGGAGTASISGGSGTLDVLAASGNVTLTGGAEQTVTAGRGQLFDTLGGGAADLTFGAGTAQVQTGNGTANFRFVQGLGGGTDIITGFDPSRDTFSFQGFGTNPVASEQAFGSSTALKLTDGTSIVLIDYTGPLS